MEQKILSEVAGLAAARVEASQMLESGLERRLMLLFLHGRHCVITYKNAR